MDEIRVGDSYQAVVSNNAPDAVRTHPEIWTGIAAWTWRMSPLWGFGWTVPALYILLFSERIENVVVSSPGILTAQEKTLW